MKAPFQAPGSGTSTAVQPPGESWPARPLTRRQMLVWSAQRLRPDVPELNAASLFVVEGALHAAAFRAAAHALVQSSDALRTVFREVDGVPVQVVRSALEVPVACVDFGRHADPLESARAWARSRAQIPFELERCAFRFELLLLGPSRSAWFLALHHIIEDGWSLGLLFERLDRLYRAALEGDAGEATAPAWSGFLDDEAAYADSAACREDEAWWAERLGGQAAPTRFYGAAVDLPSSQARRHHLVLDEGCAARLRDLARDRAGFWGEAVALQSLLCTVLGALVHRIGPNERVTVAVPFHNRTEAHHQTVGLCMQLVPLPIVFGCAEDGATPETFDAIHEQVTLATLEALPHARFAVANPIRRRAWDVILNLIPARFDRFAGLAVHHEWIFPQHADVALSVQVQHRPDGGLDFAFDTRLDVIPEPCARRLPGHFRRLLDALLDDPSAPLHDVDLLADDERDRIRFAFNAEPAVTVGTLHGLFEARASRHPDRVALRCGEIAMTYAALNRQANQLARHLRDLGAGPDVAVGIHLERDADVVVAVLATLKAGAAYLPLDPSYPEERLAFMAADAEAPLAIGRGALPAWQGVRFVRLDADVEAIACRPDGDLPPAAGFDSESLAYVIYTSGSSGRPKGVRTPHRAVVSFLEAVRGSGWLGADDTLLAVSPLSFDFHVIQIYLPLLCGGTVALASREEAVDGQRLRQRLRDYGVTAFAATPTTFRMLLEAGWEGDPRMKVHVGGETLPPDLGRRLLPLVASVDNVYGPTETTVYATTHRVGGEEGAVPVGRPLANTQVYIMDRFGRPTPIGTPGELWIAGPGVAAGYLHRAELTRERFVAHPFGETGIAYRSGDLARFREDGVVEVLGRLDGQVKIRGFRIETAEVERVLSEHEAVRDCVVDAVEDAAGERRLASWLVLDGAASVPDIQAWLRQRLPLHMVPASFVRMPSLPRTSNGKLDRRALPAAETTPDDAAPPDPPRDLMEYQLVRIFEDVLGARPVGRRDSFFERGGTSLQALRVAAEAEERLGVAFPIMTLFAAPTVELLAAALGREGWEPSLDTLVPLRRCGALAPFFCVHALIGDVCRDLARQMDPQRPFYGLQPRGLDGREEPLRRIEDMAAHYLEAMRRVQPHGPYHLGGYCFGGVVAFEMARQLERSGEKVALLAVIDAALADPRPRSWGGWMRAVTNRPLILAEKIYEWLRHEGGDPWHAALGRALRRVLARRRIGEGRAHDYLLEQDLAAMIERLQGMTRWPQHYQRIARCNFQALLQYRAGPYGGEVRLIRSEGRRYRWTLEDATLSWSEVAGAVRVECVPGQHDEIMVEPRVREVARTLERCLSEAAAAVAPRGVGEIERAG